MSELEPQTKPSPLRRIMPFLAVGLIVVLAIAILGIWQPWQASAASLPANWQTYRDPAGLFTVRIPSDWQVVQEGTSDFGNTRAQIDFPGISWEFGKPDSANPQTFTGPTLRVDVAVLTDARHRQFMCQTPPFPPGPTLLARHLGHVPVDDLGINGQMVLYAQHAYIMLAAYYPGMPTISSHPQGVPWPTPVPAAVAQADKQLIDQVVQTFRAIPDQLLAC